MQTKAYKFRIYPNEDQKILLEKTFGCVRYLWNNRVSVFNTYNKDTNPKPIYKTPAELKLEDDKLWLKEISAAALQQKDRDWDVYKKQFFSKTRKKKLGKAKFKSKHHSRFSFRLPNQKFHLFPDKSKIQLEKIGLVDTVFDRIIPDNDKLISITVSRNACYQYFASIVVETNEIKQHTKTGKVIGIDLGLKNYATLSDSTVFENPKYFRENQTKLAKAQRKLSKKKLKSSRYKKARLRVARIHNKIVNCREHFIHNITINIVKNYDVIAVENLNVEGMKRNKKLSKSISDASWGKFFQYLTYKAKWHDKVVIEVGRFFPSSKTCHACGWIDTNQTLADREFICHNCGIMIDRDLNAAINIEQQALGVDSAIRTAENL